MPLRNLNVQENPINYMRSIRSEIYISRFTKPSRQLTQDSSRGRMSLYQPPDMRPTTGYPLNRETSSNVQQLRKTALWAMFS